MTIDTTTTVQPPLSATQLESMSMAKALNAGLRRAMTENDRVLLMGEDIGPLGGVFRITEGLHAEFGPKRVLDTPLAESAQVRGEAGDRVLRDP